MDLHNAPSTMLGDRLRRRRRDVGLTQDDVAAKLGIQRNTVGRWEQNCIAPYDVLVRWARILDLDINVSAP